MANDNQNSKKDNVSGKPSNQKTLDQILRSLPKPMNKIRATEGYEPENELSILREEKKE